MQNSRIQLPAQPLGNISAHCLLFLIAAFLSSISSGSCCLPRNQNLIKASAFQMFLSWILCLSPSAFFQRKINGVEGRLGGRDREETEKSFSNSAFSIILPPQFYFRQSLPLHLFGFHDNCSHLESSLHDTSVFQWPKSNALLKMLGCSTLFFRRCSF